MVHALCQGEDNLSTEAGNFSHIEGDLVRAKLSTLEFYYMQNLL